MPYNRNLALQYAQNHWDRPCDDGIVWLTNQSINIAQKRTTLGAPASAGWEARFVPDISGAEELVFIRPPTPGSGNVAVTIPELPGMWEKKLINGWDGLADCAHALSKFLQAGGMNVSATGVGTLVQALQAKPLTESKTLCEKVPKDAAQRVLDTGIVQPGDVIGYFNIDPDGDFGQTNVYTHSTMYVGVENGIGRVTCHTKSRLGRKYKDDPWWLTNSYQYTLLHLSSDDPAPSATTVSLLQGWWQVSYPGRLEFYKFESNGTVRYTLTKPLSGGQAIAALGSAYWFERNGEVIIIWRKTGTVDRWHIVPPSPQLSLTVNGAAGSATKLFV